MDIEVSLLQGNVEKISFGTCRNSQGKCSHDSSAAQYSPGTSLTQPTPATAQSSLTTSWWNSSLQFWLQLQVELSDGCASGWWCCCSWASWEQAQLKGPGSVPAPAEYWGLYGYKGFTKPCKPRILLNVTAFKSSNIGLKHILEASVLNIFLMLN